MSFPKFNGNCPRNVSKDARYTVRSGSGRGDLVIGLLYRSDNGEEWHASSDEHTDLAEMVNAVKVDKTFDRNGSFYINEYKQVIVPTADSRDYYLAGRYVKPLRFEFEGHVISGEATDLNGEPLQPGDIWEGPHAGIPYQLCAGAKDIQYVQEVRTDVTKKVRLSKHIGPKEARKVAAQIREIKGYEGGRFYVNECCCVFAPMPDGWHVKYQYIGKIDLDRWFPEPEPAQAEGSPVL